MDKISNHQCPKCGSNRAYSFRHDTFYCSKCLIWLEDRCDDPKCIFCDDRPSAPSFVGPPSETREESKKEESKKELPKWVSGTLNKITNRCPMIMVSEDGKSAKVCWILLKDGVCPSHGSIFKQPSKPK